jgi:uncharacterized Zn finger protein (UPF0148 family)
MLFSLFASNAYGATNYAKCSLSGCDWYRTSGSKYCSVHTCQQSGCNSLSNGNGTIYCDVHAAAYARRQGYKICSYAKCYRPRVSQGLYCSSHTCRVAGCTRIIKSGSDYCTTHNTSSSRSKNYSYSYSSSSKKKSSSSSKKKSDPYDVYDYDDVEDFYEDNYDDFDSFEDAEDYYDEARD